MPTLHLARSVRGAFDKFKRLRDNTRSLFHLIKMVSWYAANRSLSRTSLRPRPRWFAERGGRATLRRDRAGAAGAALQATPGQLHPADPQSGRTRGRRAEQ